MFVLLDLEIRLLVLAEVRARRQFGKRPRPVPRPMPIWPRPQNRLVKSVVCIAWPRPSGVGVEHLPALGCRNTCPTNSVPALSSDIYGTAMRALCPIFRQDPAGCGRSNPERAGRLTTIKPRI